MTPDRLLRPCSAASLALFRIAFGLLVTIEAGRYLNNGWIDYFFLNPTYHFSWGGLNWIKPWSGSGMFWHFFSIGVLGLLVAFGVFYRVSSVCLFLSYAYVFLIDRAFYQNHHYLIVLVSGLLCILPAERTFSFDSRFRAKSGYARQWHIWLLKFQFSVVYFYGGIAKLNLDWLNGSPIRIWLHTRMSVPGFELAPEFFTVFFSYGGLLLDLVIAPCLWIRRARFPALFFCLFFHLTNAVLFDIGIFPWLMIASLALFFEPDWPNRVIGCPSTTPPPFAPIKARLLKLGLGSYALLQIAIPLRHWLYPGNVSWTSEGHFFSWRMMVNHQEFDIGFRIVDPKSGQVWQYNPEAELTSVQVDRFYMPAVARDYAVHLRHRWSQLGYPDVKVQVALNVSLNGRPRQPVVDPEIDLSRCERIADCVLPLEAELPVEQRLVFLTHK